MSLMLGLKMTVAVLLCLVKHVCSNNTDITELLNQDP